MLGLPRLVLYKHNVMTMWWCAANNGSYDVHPMVLDSLVKGGSDASKVGVVMNESTHYHLA